MYHSSRWWSDERLKLVWKFIPQMKDVIRYQPCDYEFCQANRISCKWFLFVSKMTRYTKVGLTLWRIWVDKWNIYWIRISRDVLMWYYVLLIWIHISSWSFDVKILMFQNKLTNWVPLSNYKFVECETKIHKPVLKVTTFSLTKPHLWK